MKFFFNGGAFAELAYTLTSLGHTLSKIPPWLVFTDNDQVWHNYNIKLLKEQIRTEKPDVYICSKGFKGGKFIYPDTNEWIKKQVRATIYWSMDDPFFMPTFLSKHMYKGYDFALSCSTASFAEYRQVKLKPYLFWPAWDTISREYSPVSEKNKIDMVFVGTPYVCTDIPRKDILLWAVSSGWSVEIYGSENWISNKMIKNNRLGSFIQGDSRLAPYYKGPWNNWVTLPTLFSKARINFSNHVVKAPMYLNDRVPMVMGVGGCLVIDRNPGVDTIYRHNHNIVFYDDWKTLQHRATYFLKNVHVREELGKNARQTTLEAHTYKQRAHQLLRILEENGIK